MNGKFYDVWVCNECGNQVENPPGPIAKCRCGSEDIHIDEEKSVGLPDDWKLTENKQKGGEE
ncbi:MAG: hypothetical protein ABEJ56_05640 [Candidatus Nanohaloarchaea archaeon]